MRFAPRIAEITTERRLELKLVFLGQLLPDLFQLFFVAHHDPEMPHGGWLNSVDFEDREKLVLAELEEGVAFALLQLFEIKNILIERDRLLDVIHFDRDVIAAVDLRGANARRNCESRLFSSMSG